MPCCQGESRFSGKDRSALLWPLLGEARLLHELGLRPPAASGLGTEQRRKTLSWQHWAVGENVGHWPCDTPKSMARPLSEVISQTLPGGRGLSGKNTDSVHKGLG